jgi:sugar/nucleoside kinase (ribokinase family)
VATALVTLARLGTPSGYLGKLGDDPIGAMIQRDLEAEGVSTARVVVQPGRKSLSATVLVDLASVAAGESVIKCPSPLNVLKDIYDHRCY